ncbi:tetratricopeptide repeat protein [Cellvibrio sp. OA-2007]|uniref:tetratricopeptide repeat protein n=1 Tax=Cellvibrio sp. OA-2007 TaxID=529823 RepID=UPI0007814F7A|nr:hypothetical protein [Cellvibrio sp. OA-2007]
MELPDDIYTEIEELSEAGNQLCDDENFTAAIEKWNQALMLLPDPKSDWEAYTWLSASIGDALYQLKDFAAAREKFFDALNGPDGRENPFVHYRLGQCEIHIGNEENGINHLLQAYMLDGEDIFQAEDDGAVYLQKLSEKNLT